MDVSCPYEALFVMRSAWERELIRSVQKFYAAVTQAWGLLIVRGLVMKSCRFRYTYYTYVRRESQL